MKPSLPLLGVACSLLAASSPADAFRLFRSSRDGEATEGGEQEANEIGRQQAGAAKLLQNAAQGLSRWASRAASLQELDFVTRFTSWLGSHSGSLAQVEEAFERLTATAEWIDCAKEHDRCTCDRGVARYGAANKWVYKTFSNGTAFQCSNEVFLKDPSPGDGKMCQCYRKLTDPGTAPGVGPTDGPLLWSCGNLTSGSSGGDGAEAPDSVFANATKAFCSDEQLAGSLEVFRDPRFDGAFATWADERGWVKEAYVTYMAGKRNSNFEWMATNLIRSVHLFSNRPIVVVNFDSAFEPPPTWHDFPNLIVYRMQPKVHFRSTAMGMSFNFNKIRAMIGARVETGIQVDLDQVVFAGMDSLFPASRREITKQYPYPILPVHWMSRDGRPGDPYYVYRFKSYRGKPSMRWNHAHPTWSFWALPFLTDMLRERLSAAPPQLWMNEDEDMLNVELWQRNLSKAWCKFDLEPGLFTDDKLAQDLYYDSYWYPKGLPLMFFSAHNTKRVEETDWLLTLMARCGEPAMRKKAKCPSSVQGCRRGAVMPAELEKLLASSKEAAAELCCCVRAKEETPIFWQGRWYRKASEVPEVDSDGAGRRCLLP